MYRYNVNARATANGRMLTSKAVSMRRYDELIIDRAMAAMAMVAEKKPHNTLYNKHTTCIINLSDVNHKSDRDSTVRMCVSCVWRSCAFSQQSTMYTICICFSRFLVQPTYTHTRTSNNARRENNINNNNNNKMEYIVNCDRCEPYVWRRDTFEKMLQRRRRWLIVRVKIMVGSFFVNIRWEIKRNLVG